jgi:hypothetical protein
VLLHALDQRQHPSLAAFGGENARQALQVGHRVANGGDELSVAQAVLGIEVRAGLLQVQVLDSPKILTMSSTEASALTRFKNPRRRSLIRRSSMPSFSHTSSNALQMRSVDFSAANSGPQ